ncbi:hypothetical protein A2130_02790 [Candidatus Woesebacteria bacterium GWC2_33_12]|uniref:BrnT family toxin n=1 Tax=Candidatus Woesebacteria bacterium GW2011_GWB1_33_22 TaxID=1618566 RepID=A0A0G0BZ02_9BACT|nr:MAG: hypothetical protein UR29_C0013G0058 [Candidatus Woesebacteria bacterium GW2011_GWC2_33_12]KKP41745.1 MAG: hypothetical protein UR33_C0011G0060 [Candidatus Woesebacteria bacterium GW2011_GWA2_33_20]KKP44120.1 MAG: hypothetical protein UR35_C0011G0006 [Candidatus Woesebacteria bacterium GW2011_GWB1_33_22]KKP45779.1 MAG: hypothetical protein UR37_C0014G0006 [Microgenomates group bacterium GW2011_GWC1_33_28]KKP50202.1 MAG: hypothetical protein UR41_C0010G0006 [Candidatus Woesebacteria bact
MTRIEINNLVWNDWNVEHVKKHGLTKRIIENAILNIKAFRYGYRARIVLICEFKGNFISIVVDRKTEGKYYIVTARSADRKERKLTI